MLLCAAAVKADESFDPMLFVNEQEAEANAFKIEPPKPSEVMGNKITRKIKSSVPDTQTQMPLMDSEDLDFPEEDTPALDEKEAPVIVPQIQPSSPALGVKKPQIRPTAGSEPVDTSQGLVDAISDEHAADKIDLTPPVPKVDNTWIGKIKEKAEEIAVNELEGKHTSDDKINLNKMLENSKQKSSRSNASVFDISGLMLRMSKAQVEKTMQTRGFQKIHEKFEIPNFIKWRNEEKCRGRGVVGYERLANCVVEQARKDGNQYTETLKFAKFDTQENIEVRFTSNFTQNKVYKVSYRSMSPKLTGNSAKALYLRNVKIYDFWKLVNQKYGSPDNKDEVIWGMGGNKPYLQASSGYLLLEDPMLRELDYTRMSREDQRYMNTNLYNF